MSEAEMSENTAETRTWTARHTRALIGWVFIVAAALVIIAGYESLPDAATCQAINYAQQVTGGSPTCATTPAAGYFTASAVLGGLGLLTLAPWWLGWLVRK